jgi:A/G-specific adenine glycosylase
MGIRQPNLADVAYEHRVFFLSREDSQSVCIPAELRKAFSKYANANVRTFPWRQPGTLPFHLLLAEILLAQTKASDVASIWPTLIDRYPTPGCLAAADFRDLSNLLRPLGLQHQRANALRTLARHIAEQWKGEIPSSIIDLLSIPHVGLYTASAVNCFVHQRRVPLVDANVLRVIGRVFGLPMQRELRRSRTTWAIAWALLPARNVAKHNYGLLDFAAQVCTPKAPHCNECPIKAYCTYGSGRDIPNEPYEIQPRKSFKIKAP